MKILEKDVSDIIHNVFKLDVDCVIDNEFYYDGYENILGFPPYYFKEEKNINYHWKPWLENTFNIELEFWQLFPLSFLHELGHKITLKNISDDEYAQAMLVDDEIQYYCTKREYVATAWAIRLCLHHADLINEFCAQLNEAFARFYERNEVHE